MRQIALSLLLGVFAISALSAQIGCPGCQTNLPPLPADTLYLQNLPDGEQGQTYDHDISFRVPKTTTPVNAVDSVTPPGLPISKIEIVSLEGLPPGLNWQPSQWSFQTDSETDGCIRICGTPEVADSFVLIVKLKATVFIITQEASFPMSLYIAPPTVSNDGFSMANYAGCGSTTVSFTNNHPSGVSPDYTYAWDFGDGTTFDGENPPPHTYNTPGVYPVNYYAAIDTGRFVLKNATVIDVDCVDQLGLGAPDLYLLVKGPDGQLLFDSSPDVENTSLPFTFPVGLALDAGNYTIEVWDEDSGLKGSDDPCGTVSFNYLSNDTLVAGGFEVALVIEKPVTELFSVDTVFVYEQPAAPTVTAPNGLSNCTGNPTLSLESSSTDNNQWLLNGDPLAGATSNIYVPQITGYYQVQITNAEGCKAVSDSVLVGLYTPPAEPVFANHLNLLYLTDSIGVPASYDFQWFLSGVPIQGETGWTVCTAESGVYGLVVTDANTGCSNFFAGSVTYDPNYPDCISGTKDIAIAPMSLFPNPASTEVTLQWQEGGNAPAVLRMFDTAGRMVKQETIPGGVQAHTFSCSGLSPGVYTLSLSGERSLFVGRLVIMK